MCPPMWKSTVTYKHAEGVKEAFFRLQALTISRRQVYRREGNVDVERMLLRQSKELMFISQGKHIKLPVVPGRGGGGKTVF